MAPKEVAISSIPGTDLYLRNSLGLLEIWLELPGTGNRVGELREKTWIYTCGVYADLWPPLRTVLGVSSNVLLRSNAALWYTG